MGGGLQHLGFFDHDVSNGLCVRTDQRNLIQTFLLGIFAPNHLPYELKRDSSPKGTPSLAEMTRKGLEILKKGP